MRTFGSLEAARAAAHPGQFVMASTRLAAWAVATVGERQQLRAGDAWRTVERVKPFHDVAAEVTTGWHADDIADAQDGPAAHDRAAAAG